MDLKRRGSDVDLPAGAEFVELEADQVAAVLGRRSVAGNSPLAG